MRVDPTAKLTAALRRDVRGDVDDSQRRRSEYSSDASNYRVRPTVVVAPRDEDDVRACVQIAREHNSSITARGAGTSVAGNAVGPGVIVDFSRHMCAIRDVDPAARTARVQPGVVLGDLQRNLAAHGLRYGPDPSTASRATLGGMIGNNACGPHSLSFGRTADTVQSLRILDGVGRELTVGSGARAFDDLPELERVLSANLATIRTSMGRFKRQVSGYSLEHLLPENGHHVARMLVGSEGTLGVLLEATVSLVPRPKAPVVVALGYVDMAAAADAVPLILEHHPLAVEGLDRRLVDVVRRHRGAHHVPQLPEGGGWLIVEVSGNTAKEAMSLAGDLAAASGTTAIRIVDAGPEAQALWQIRADGAGLGGRTPSGAPAWPGWEDAAVPPDRLGSYLRDFEALMGDHGVDGLLYGHFGDGCVHVRLDLPLTSPAGVDRSRRFLEESADLVVHHGGSLSGEHGDGRARSALLRRMYSPEVLQAFAQVKHVFDPERVLNPGIIVDPLPLTDDLRRPLAREIRSGEGFGFVEDGGDFTTAVHRCTGVAKCRAPGGFMCPSFQATRDEKDVTRGRARVLQDLTTGEGKMDWRAPEVLESLDLCLSCKACSTECPTGIDMARYKSEVLHRAYRGRLRPRSHYALGRLPQWARYATRWRAVTLLVNRALSNRIVKSVVLRAGGLDPRRDVAPFAEQTFRRWWTERESPRTPHHARSVVLFVDTFTNHMSPVAAVAMVRLLEDAGYHVLVPEASPCCGLTLISTGQLDQAKRALLHLVDVFYPYVNNDVMIVGVEPSCTAVLRSDLGDLLPEDPRTDAIASATRTLAELLASGSGPGQADHWTVPRLDGLSVVAQPHCHHHSVMGWDADAVLLDQTGATVERLSGCCGLAGNFGMEQGHYEVSVAVAGNSLIPALQADPAAIYLADGFSCRTQASQLVGKPGVHLAQLLWAARQETGVNHSPGTDA